MKRVRHNILVLIYISISISCFSLTIYDLLEFTIESNLEIQEAQKNYEMQILSSKNNDGFFSPSISINTSTNIPKHYEFDSFSNNFDSNIIYSQPLSSGTTVSFEFNNNFNTISLNNDAYVSQSSKIVFSLSQTLLPFWFQGQIEDPMKLSLKQKEEYYYYQLLYVKKNVLIQVLQNYILALVSRNEIAIWENTLNYYTEQINSLKNLIEKGNESQLKVIEVENLKWTAQQNLIAARTNYATYIQNLKKTCGRDFDDTLLETTNINNSNKYILSFLNEVTDPLERIYLLKTQMLKTNRILEKQSSAPVLKVTVIPIWNYDTVKQEEWKTILETKEQPENWTVSLGINLSPMIMALAKKDNEKYQLEIQFAQEAYSSYLNQKNFVKQQYELLLLNYLQQKETISNLYDLGIQELIEYEYQFNIGNINKLDFDSVCLKVKNCGHSKSCIELYILLYEMLVKLQ